MLFEKLTHVLTNVKNHTNLEMLNKGLQNPKHRTDASEEQFPRLLKPPAAGEIFFPL